MGLQPHPRDARTPPLAMVATQTCLKPVVPNASMQHYGRPSLGLSGEAAEVKKPFQVPVTLSAGKASVKIRWPH